MLRDLYLKLRHYNGLDAALQVDEIIMDGTFIRAEQQGSSQQSQLVVHFQPANLDKEQYRALKQLQGESVLMRVGKDSASLSFDSISTIPLDARWEEQSSDPIELIFSETELMDKSLAKDLQTAGYNSLSSRVRHIQSHTSQKGNAKLAQAVESLRQSRMWALAERLEQSRIALFGDDESQETDHQRASRLLEDASLQYLGIDREQVEGSEDWNVLINNMLMSLKPQLDSFVSPVEEEEPEPVEEEPEPEEEEPMEEDEEVEALGPMGTPREVRGPQTVLIQNNAPKPKI